MPWKSPFLISSVYLLSLLLESQGQEIPVSLNSQGCPSSLAMWAGSGVVFSAWAGRFPPPDTRTALGTCGCRQAAESVGGSADPTGSGASHPTPRMALEAPAFPGGFFLSTIFSLCLPDHVAAWRAPSWGREMTPFSICLPTCGWQWGLPCWKGSTQAFWVSLCFPGISEI